KRPCPTAHESPPSILSMPRPARTLDLSLCRPAETSGPAAEHPGHPLGTSDQSHSRLMVYSASFNSSAARSHHRQEVRTGRGSIEQVCLAPQVTYEARFLGKPR